MTPFHRFKFFLFNSFFLLMISCNPQDKISIEKSASAFDIEQGKASILQSNQNFMKSFKAGDSTGVANSYTTDGKIMAPNTPSISGRDDIQHYISGFINKGVHDFKISTIKVWGDSSVLAEEGTYQLSDSSNKQIDKGKYIVLWKQESGNWKMFRDIWNSDLSLTALPSEITKTKE
ncbi:MAG: DUF4440 domain-containing protein [Bacteroidota bacterium]|nr:DUF4440 domain-containing protein [Bacteroidota bacterium]MDQ6890186.1 DUF4440 domain-containing protein [Bacteroidota bacterium]